MGLLLSFHGLGAYGVLLGVTPTPAHRAWSTWAPARCLQRPGSRYPGGERDAVKIADPASQAAASRQRLLVVRASQARAPSSGRGLLPAPPFLRATQAAPLSRFGSSPASRRDGGPAVARPLQLAPLPCAPFPVLAPPLLALLPIRLGPPRLWPVRHRLWGTSHPSQKLRPQN